MMKSPSQGGRGLRLEKLCGLSAGSTNAVHASAVGNGVVAFPAGCVVVTQDAENPKQQAYMRMAKPVACVRFSQDGRFLAVGEKGHSPAITVWDAAAHVRLAELRGHKFGISCVRFSPDGATLASAGFEHDDKIILWDWRKEAQMACEETGDGMVNSMEFADERHLVSAGDKAVVFWEIQKSEEKESGNNELPWALQKHKAGILPDYEGTSFLDVVCGSGELAGYTYIGTSCGSLLCLGSNRMMEKWVFLEAKSVYSLALGNGLISCACNDGIVRVFKADSFEFVTSLPLPRKEGVSINNQTPGDVDDDLDESDEDEENSTEGQGFKYADAVSIHWSHQYNQLLVAYSDRSMYVWDVSDFEHVTLHSCFHSHPKSISGIVALRHSKRAKAAGIPDSILVSSSDDRVLRFWKLNSAKKKKTLVSELWQNSFGQELVREIHLPDQNIGGGGDSSDLSGLKSLGSSRDGTLIGVGDRSGGVIIYDLVADKIVFNDPKAHSGEVMSVDFSPKLAGGSEARILMATGGRDRVVQIYSWSSEREKWSKAKTLKDHSAIVTSVAFSTDGQRILSAGGDKTVVSSEISFKEGEIKVTRVKSVTTEGTAQDIDVDASNKYFCTVGQDKKINVWSLSNCKPIRSYKPDGDIGELTTVHFDLAGMYCAVGSNDKKVRLFDFYSGECIAKAAGHGEPLAGLAFTNDCKRLISVSWDGCMFVWRLAPEITSAIKERLEEIELQSTLQSAKPSITGDEDQRENMYDGNENGHPKSLVPPNEKRMSPQQVGDLEFEEQEEEVNDGLEESDASNPEKSKSLFSSDQLPTWARRKGEDNETEVVVDEDEEDIEPTSNVSEKNSQGKADEVRVVEIDESSSVSSSLTAPRSPLPEFGEARSLSQERHALKMQEQRKESDTAVRRMRDQLKSLGILSATVKKPAFPEDGNVIAEENSITRDDATVAKEKPLSVAQDEDNEEGNHLESDLEDADGFIGGLVSPFVGEAQEHLSEEPADRSTSTLLQNQQKNLGVPSEIPSRVKEDEEKLERVAAREQPPMLSPPKTLDLPSASQKGSNGIDTIGFTASNPLKTAEDARSACEFALGQLKSALLTTTQIFQQVETLEGNLSVSLNSVRPNDDFTKDVLQTSRDHVQGIMGEFCTQLQDLVDHQIGPLTSRRESFGSVQNPPSSMLGRSMFLPNGTSSLSSSNADMQTVLSKLSSISTLLEKVVNEKSGVSNQQ